MSFAQSESNNALLIASIFFGGGGCKGGFCVTRWENGTLNSSFLVFELCKVLAGDTAQGGSRRTGLWRSTNKMDRFHEI